MKKSSGRKLARTIARENRKAHGRAIIEADKKRKRDSLWKKKKAARKLAKKQRKEKI